MASIRRWGVVAGGAVAGLILVATGLAIGRFVLMPELAALPPEWGSPGVVPSLVFQCATGFVVVWVYVGFRPRFGAGRRSIIAASAAVWLARSSAMLTFTTLYGVLSPLTIALLVVLSLIELTVACFAGAGIYRRHSAAITRRRGRQLDADVASG